MSLIDKLKEKVRLITEIIDDDDKLLIGGTIPDILADLEGLRPYVELAEIIVDKYEPTPVISEYEPAPYIRKIDNCIQQIRSKQ